MRKQVVVLGILSFLIFFPVTAHAIDLHYETGKTYGPVQEIAVVEVPADGSLAQDIYTLFAASKPYFKIVNPTSSFPGSPAFSTLDGAAGGWYLTLSPGGATLGVISSFTGRTARPVVVELTSYDASFIQSLRSQYPSVKVHAGHYLFWPRDDVKNAFAQTPPPAMEAVSVWFEETSSDMFVTLKLLFDTMFDASNDIPGTSGVKINYPPNSFLALSDIKPKFSDESRKTAFRIGVAGGAAVSFVQTQGKSKKAPVKYVGLGQISGMSASARTIVARYAKFISLTPQVIWPMAMAGNGGPYDNDFFPESNSKPVMGVIGVVSGKPEGVIVNASGQSVSVNLPGDPGSSKAYSSLTGDFSLTTSFQLSPYETIIFGDNTSNTQSSSPPPIVPTTPPRPTSTIIPSNPPPSYPTPPPSNPTSSPVLQPTSVPRQPFPSATPVYFPMGNQPAAPGQGGVVNTETSGSSFATMKKNIRLIVVRTDPLLQALAGFFLTIKRYDGMLETYINTALEGVAGTVLRR